jgi:hypothetical protein
MTWSVSGSTASLTWEIRESLSNDTTTGSVSLSGSSGTSTTTGEYLEYGGPLYKYFWIHYVGASAWFPLAENALNVTDCSGDA